MGSTLLDRVRDLVRPGRVRREREAMVHLIEAHVPTQRRGDEHAAPPDAKASDLSRRLRGEWS